MIELILQHISSRGFTWMGCHPWPADLQLVISTIKWYLSHLVNFDLFLNLPTFKLLIEFVVELRVSFVIAAGVFLILIELEMNTVKWLSIKWTPQVAVDIRKFIATWLRWSRLFLNSKVFLRRNSWGIYRRQLGIIDLFLFNYLLFLLLYFNFTYWLIPAVVINIFIFILRIPFVPWSIKLSFFYNYVSISIIFFYINLIKYVCHCLYVLLTEIQTWEPWNLLCKWWFLEHWGGFLYLENTGEEGFFVIFIFNTFTHKVCLL